MPDKSPRQARFMAGIEHNAAFAHKVGVPQSVGREFRNADRAAGVYRNLGKGHTMKDGGNMGQPGNEGGVSQRKVMAGNNKGGNMGVESMERANRHAGMHPDQMAGTGMKGAMADSDRATGPGVPRGKMDHDMQAAPDHGPTHVGGYNQHSYGDKA
jgi:hypothetical protein